MNKLQFTPSHSPEPEPQRRAPTFMSTSDEQHTLHFLTFDKPAEQPPEPCSGGYTCICTTCAQERKRAVARGIRPHGRNDGIPVRRAA